MDERICTITLADGTKLEGLTMNGNNFVSQDPVFEDIFEYNLSPVTISDGETEEIHDNMALVQVTRMGTENWFVLRDLSRQELDFAKMQSDIDYLRMMTGVE